jgi:hypothetical protein
LLYFAAEERLEESNGIALGQFFWTFAIVGNAAPHISPGILHEHEKTHS